MNFTRHLLLALTVTLTLAACGGGGAATPPTSPAPAPTPSPAPTPTPSPTPTPGAYQVTGRVLTEAGKPMAGVSVFASHTASTTSREVKTDAQGRYTLTLPQTLGSWTVTAYVMLNFGGQNFDVRLDSEVDVPFAGAQGAVRDFVYRTEDAPTGKVYDYIDNSDVEIDYGTLEVTFVPEGQNAAMSTAPIKVKYPFGSGLPDLPLGVYKVSATHTRNGTKEQLLVATRDNPNYAPQATARFLPDSHYGPTLEVFWKNP